MNYSIIRYIIGKVIFIEGIILAIPAVTAIFYAEWNGMLIYLICGAIYSIIGSMLSRNMSGSRKFYAKEGYVIAALAWIIISILGAVPIAITGDIPSFIDAVFEISSGFTTTGASILSDPSKLMHCNLIWRSFTHWLGGMGVLVFLIAVLPPGGGETLHIMRAESTGPSVGKIVPRIKQTSKILYGIYAGMTVIMFIMLLIGRMPVFDSICTALGTAGTGGFGIRADSMGSYSTYTQVVVTVFMLLFGINFSFYYLVLIGKAKEAFKMEEVRIYAAIYTVVTLLITINMWLERGSFLTQLQQSAFQAASIITTTGFATQDFNMWPMFSKLLIGLLMCTGGCAGSTAGGIKVYRIMIYVKGIFKEIASQVHPKRVKVICVDGKRIMDDTLRIVYVYLALFIVMSIASMIIISADGFDFETTFTAVLTTLNNVGPGFGTIGPASNFAAFSPLSKIVLTVDMIAGRLELIPMMVLLMPATWKKNG